MKEQQTFPGKVSVCTVHNLATPSFGAAFVILPVPVGYWVVVMHGLLTQLDAVGHSASTAIGAFGPGLRTGRTMEA
jgi:hypothetical protein